MCFETQVSATCVLVHWACSRVFGGDRSNKHVASRLWYGRWHSTSPPSAHIHCPGKQFGIYGEGLEGLKVNNVKPQKIVSLLTVHKTVSASCQRNSMRKWRNCTFLHAVRSSQYLLRNKQITSVASLMAHSKVGTTVIEMQGFFEGVVAGGVFLRHGSRQHQASSGSRRLPRWSWLISSRLRVGFRPTADLGV